MSDPFEWLEDAARPDTARWIEAHETAYEQAARRWTTRDHWAARTAALADAALPVGAPRPFGDRLFATRTPPGAEHPQLVVIEPDGRVRVVVDPSAIDPSGATTLEHWEPSPDGRRLAFQLSVGGTEQTTIEVLDVDTGTVLDLPIGRVRRSTLGWLDGARGFFYVRSVAPHGSVARDRRVFLHMVGDDPADDAVVFGDESDATRFYAVRTSADGRWLSIGATTGAARQRDVWLADLSAGPPGRPTFRVVQQGVEAWTTVRPPTGDRLGFLHTDLGAPRGRIASFTPADPTPPAWRDVIPADEHAVVDDYVLLDGLETPVLVVARIRHAVSEVTVHDAHDGRQLATLALPPCSSIGPLRAAPTGATAVWFTCSTFTSLPEVMHYDARTGHLGTWSPSTAPSPAPSPDALPPGLVTRQFVARSADGTAVRYFVVAATDRPDQPRPTLLTGYGGFGQSMTPSFSPEAIAWAEAGGVFAVACVRGGGEEGEEWHRAGMRQHKQRCFEDFEAVADALVGSGWTSQPLLGIWGASNGGLLVGAAITRRPHAYGAAACLAPLLDMLRYERSGMGASWVAEYGTAADPEQAAWLRAYSPYHHVRPGTRYPATLFAVFDGDSRVDPWHARKMLAAMFAADGEGVLLMRLERGVGHGARSASRRTALFADVLGFFADRLSGEDAHASGTAERNRACTGREPGRPSVALKVGALPTRTRQEKAMANDEVLAHGTGETEDEAGCGIQFNAELTGDDVIAHSADDETEDEAGCAIQFNAS
ncbi:prolyl oligopeptidase family serine peptidase [Micromonospora carbonacea]|uniref:prolyl oligopeptidase family serine peptidase n=1 Tax=Micromonospora carbonacea TaxID=47853 RepID=UPI0033194865